jgi:uracil-DNA glycosylase
VAYALQEPDLLFERQTRVDAPHVAPLNELVREMRSETAHGDGIPWFDPEDGGAEARVLFLMEAPGRKAIESGFVSRDNPDPSAKNMCEICEEADLPRSATVIWNIVPWYVGSKDRTKIRPATRKDIDSGIPWLLKMLDRCPALLAIVLFGQQAQRGWDVLSRKNNGDARLSLPVFRTWHTSGQCLNPKPDRRDEIVRTLSVVGRSLR